MPCKFNTGRLQRVSPYTRDQSFELRLEQVLQQPFTLTSPGSSRAAACVHPLAEPFVLKTGHKAQV